MEAHRKERRCWRKRAKLTVTRLTCRKQQRGRGTARVERASKEQRGSWAGQGGEKTRAVQRKAGPRGKLQEGGGNL